jgi:hypothetical protein
VLVKEPRARRTPLGRGGDSRARRSTLEGGVSPRARRTLLEGAPCWAVLVGRGATAAWAVLCVYVLC